LQNIADAARVLGYQMLGSCTQNARFHNANKQRGGVSVLQNTRICEPCALSSKWLAATYL